MNHIFTVYLLALVLFTALDGIWLVIMSRLFYAQKLAHLLDGSVSWWAVGLFYLLYVAGILYFVINPALQLQSSFLKTFLTGAFLGIIAYGTYDLTNQATLKNWPIIVTIADMIWGAIGTGTISTLAVFILRKLV